MQAVAAGRRRRELHRTAGRHHQLPLPHRRLRPEAATRRPGHLGRDDLRGHLRDQRERQGRHPDGVRGAAQDPGDLGEAEVRGRLPAGQVLRQRGLSPHLDLPVLPLSPGLQDRQGEVETVVR